MTHRTGFLLYCWPLSFQLGSITSFGKLVQYNLTERMNMIKYILPLVALLTACSGPIEEPVVEDMVLGTNEQPLFLPFAFGVERGTENGVKFPQCSPPFANGLCDVPRYRKLDINVKSSTCTALNLPPNYRNALNLAAGNVKSFTTALGWDVKTSENVDLNRSNSVKLSIGCAQSKPGVMGEAQANPEQLANCLPAGSAGVVCRYSSANAVVFATQTDNYRLSQGMTLTQFDTFLQNVARHEIYHMVGLGHNLSSGTLMHTNSVDSPLAIPLPGERDAIDCYAPTGSSPAC